MKNIINKDYPRLPLDGKLDLTYRCNNACRHCWLWLPPSANEKQNELSFEEWRQIIDQARAMGCQAWSISGGEPMLRPDFTGIFDYLTRKAVSYKLNTNGTLITPEIARLLTRRGDKMVALYGATADVHDHVTRTPGSFEAAMRGFAYLKEAGAPFSVQIVPMRANYHQFDQMQALAQSLSPVYRVGAAWLWLSGCPSEARNREIAAQRLDPKEVIVLDTPSPATELFNKLGFQSRGPFNQMIDYLLPASQIGGISTSIPMGRCPSAVLSKTLPCVTIYARAPSRKPGTSLSPRWLILCAGGRNTWKTAAHVGCAATAVGARCMGILSTGVMLPGLTTCARRRRLTGGIRRTGA